MVKKEDIKYLEILCGEYVNEQCYHYKFNGKQYESAYDLVNEHIIVRGERRKNWPELKFLINVKTGEVLNWPKGNPQDFYDLKVCDGGQYSLIDNDGNYINIKNGYVPGCLGDNENGDYFAFEIDENSFIAGWKFTNKDFKYLMKND